MKASSRRAFLVGLGGLLLAPVFLKRAQPQGTVGFQVDLTRSVGPCDPATWANIGYDPIYAVTVRPENQPFWEMVRESQAFRYIRCHNAFSDGRPGDPWPYGCRVYSEDVEGNPRYNWQYLDQVLDIWVRAGIKPILETDFMPDALAEGPIVCNYSYGAINTPKDYPKWRDLFYEMVRHCIERYGADEVRTWYFEIWNETDYGFDEGRKSHRNAPEIWLATNDPLVGPPEDRLATQRDIAPTILERFGLDLAQIEPPLPGRSLLRHGGGGPR